jgi:hypothetical protein
MTGLALTLLLATAAGAEASVEAEAPRLAGDERMHVALIAGPSFRTSKQVEGRLLTDYAGAVPPQLKLSVAAYFTSWLGVAVDGAAEWFSVGGAGFDGIEARVPVAAYSGSLALAGRFLTALGLCLEARLGYALGSLPSVSGANGALTAAPVLHHGPLLAAAVGLDRGWPITVQVRGVIAPIGAASSAVSAAGAAGWYGAGLELGLGRLSLLGAAWTAVLDYEFRAAFVDAKPSNYKLEQMSHRLALGLKARFYSASASPVRIAPLVTTGTLLASVVSPEGQPISGAQLEVEGRALVADEKGQFKLEKLEARKWTVTANAPDFKPASASAEVVAGEEAKLTLVLPRPSGPGSLVGTVRLKAGDLPAADATVTVKGLPPVKTTADGAYRIEGAGPGAVAVTVVFPGYLPVEEAVQVPPERTATLDVKLENKRPMARLRGKVTASSADFKATVTIVEVKQKISVSGDGKFSIDLPGGNYKVVVEAPGYLTQSRVVNLADGDQTIYYFELRAVQ